MEITNWEICPNCENDTFATFEDGSRQCYICDWCSRTYQLPEHVTSSMVIVTLKKYAEDHPGTEIEITMTGN
jgi:hypothetical protein